MVATICFMLPTFFLDWYLYIPSEMSKVTTGWPEVSFRYQLKVEICMFQVPVSREEGIVVLYSIYVSNKEGKNGSIDTCICHDITHIMSVYIGLYFKKI